MAPSIILKLRQRCCRLFWV